MWKSKPTLFSWGTVASDEEVTRGSKGFPFKNYDFFVAVTFMFLGNLFVYIEHVEPLVRHGVHRERNSEARHVCQPVHVPRRLHFWFHERSSRWSFLQSVGPQLWLVPPSHVFNPKQTCLWCTFLKEYQNYDAVQCQSWICSMYHNTQQVAAHDC